MIQDRTRSHRRGASEPIDLDDLNERLLVREMLDLLMANPKFANDPAVREFFDNIGIE